MAVFVALMPALVDKVFLGMAASFVPPKRDIVALIEDVEAAGVRFVYFSPRNMRRSKVPVLSACQVAASLPTHYCITTDGYTEA